MAALRAMLGSAALAGTLDDRSLLAGMLRFEAALARAQAQAGVVPPGAADAISRVCERLSADPEAFDTRALAASARRASTLAIPFVKQLTEAVAREDAEAARWVHLGATSQDAVDTATSLQARAAAAALDALLARLGDALAATADAHRRTPMSGRTLLQAAVPISFGWKAAGWLSAVHRSRDALARAVEEGAVLQFGGASGTLAALGAQGPAVTRALAAELGLPAAPISWHSARDRWARIGCELAVLAGTLSKIGRDLALLMQPEVAEAFEPAGSGRGGSSAMPHKRNPVSAMLALEAAYRAPGLAGALLAELASEHERGLGTWQNSAFVLADLFDAAGSALEAILEAIEGLRVDPAAMAANLARGGGFVYAEAAAMRLAAGLGKPAAQALMEEVCAAALREGRTLRDAMAADPRIAASIAPAELDALFDPAPARDAAGPMIDAVLAQWRAPGRTTDGTH